MAHFLKAHFHYEIVLYYLSDVGGLSRPLKHKRALNKNTKDIEAGFLKYELKPMVQQRFPLQRPKECVHKKLGKI